MKHRLIRFCQKHIFKVENSFSPKKNPEKRTLENGYICYNDIRYGDTYPNSFLDLYLQPDAMEKAYPTLYMIHGGGFVWGNKEDGDPNAKGRENDWFLQAFLDVGFNVITIDYAFAPDYLYPTPILQISQSFLFLQTIAKKYGLDLHKIVFWGGSAGGQLEGQFLNIQTNPVYEKEMQITPVLAKDDIKAVIFSSALLDNERFGKTNLFAFSYLFRKCGNAYFDCKRLEGHPLVIQSDVIRNICENFPPAFISDGNRGTFTEQAVDLDKKLTKYHIRHVLNLYPASEKKLMHGFECCNDEYGHKNMKELMRFLKKEGIIS